VFDFAVVIPTVLRPSLLQACQSIVAQTVEGSINVVIGVDYPRGPLKLLDDVRRLERDNRKITIIHPGYSTSSARGGVFPNPFGGALRTICSFAANARHIAYLDDDNWYAPDHLETLARAIQGKAWAFSRRWYVDEVTRDPLSEDRWESLGPGKGIYAESHGGFCDASTLLLDARQNFDLFPIWSFAGNESGTGEDRRIFIELRKRPFGESDRATVFYAIRRSDELHVQRLRLMREAGVDVSLPPSFAEVLKEIQPRPASEGTVDLLPLDLQDSEEGRFPQIASVLRSLKPRDIIEVGSRKGVSTAFICETLLAEGIEPRILCVDAWLGDLDRPENPHGCDEPRLRNGDPPSYRQFLSNMQHRGYGNFITPFQTTARRAAKFLFERQVQADFIYLDAAHQEGDVYEDLAGFWQVLRCNGVLMGDDYKPDVWPGLVRAVQRFGGEIGQQPIICGVQGALQFAFEKKPAN